MQDNKLIRIEQKLDIVLDKVAEINVTLAAQHEQLAYHIKRTDLLEAKVEPLENHAAMEKGALKLIGLIGILAAIGEGIFSALEYFRK